MSHGYLLYSVPSDAKLLGTSPPSWGKSQVSRARRARERGGHSSGRKRHLRNCNNNKLQMWGGRVRPPPPEFLREKGKRGRVGKGGEEEGEKGGREKEGREKEGKGGGGKGGRREERGGGEGGKGQQGRKGREKERSEESVSRAYAVREARGRGEPHTPMHPSLPTVMPTTRFLWVGCVRMGRCRTAPRCVCGAQAPPSSLPVLARNSRALRLAPRACAAKKTLTKTAVCLTRVKPAFDPVHQP